MVSKLKIGLFGDIPIALHTSWFLIFGLIIWSLAAGYFPESHPVILTPVYWALGGATSVLFLASVLAHELGHSYLARRFGIPERGITLFVFGGVVQITREPQSPRADFRIAIAGLVVSLALAALFGGLWLLSKDFILLATLSMWLARINLILAVFNMIPGFPLDGGRVLRAIIWRSSRDFWKATRITSFIGQVIAQVLIGLGLFVLAGGSLFNGLWLIFIGWLLLTAADASYDQSAGIHTLADLQVEQAMARKWTVVPSQLPLSLLMQGHVSHQSPRYYFIQREGYGHDQKDPRPLGMVTLTDVMKIPRNLWQITPVNKVMVPWDNLVTVHPQAPLLQAVQIIDDAKVTQLPVLDGGGLVGILSRKQIESHWSVCNVDGTRQPSRNDCPGDERSGSWRSHSNV